MKLHEWSLFEVLFDFSLLVIFIEFLELDVIDQNKRTEVTFDCGKSR